jgi:cytoskeletal protein CcmA (bactofilin family)
MKGIIASVALFFAAVNIAYADEGFGMCNYGNQTVPSVICYGPAVLKQTIVGGNIKVVGPLTARNVVARSLSVNGTADVENSDIQGPVDITGYLQAYNCHFLKGMTVNSDNILLNHTVITGDVTVNSSATKPTIKLLCSSSITGTLTFGGIAGVIQVSDDSTLQGKIHNGTMEFVRVECN